MKQLLLAIIPLLIVATIVNVYASGPRLDYSETYEDVPGAPECYVDGYDAGFANKCDKNRAQECNDIPGDQYNAGFGYGCIKEGDDDLGSHEQLQEENRRNCYDDGYQDGKDSNSYDSDRASGCSEYSSSYTDGFSAAANQ